MTRGYHVRRLASTVVLVAAATVFLVFTALYLPNGLPRNLLWGVLFFGTTALAPAPWLAPPLALGFFWIVVVLAPSEASCPVGGICEPVALGRDFLVSAIFLVVSSTAGAALRSTLGWRRRRVERSHAAEKMPWADPAPTQTPLEGDPEPTQQRKVQARDEEARHQDPDQ